jgi:hypothetical protein
MGAVIRQSRFVYALQLSTHIRSLYCQCAYSHGMHGAAACCYPAKLATIVGVSN